MICRDTHSFHVKAYSGSCSDEGISISLLHKDYRIYAVPHPGEKRYKANNGMPWN